MRYFYGRVSDKSQNLDRQLVVAEEYECDVIFTDKQSGKDFNRPEYIRLKATVVAGDEVIVKELDRLGRNKQEIKEEIQWFKTHGVILRILNIPTTLIDFKDQEWIRDMVNNILIEVLGTIAEEERNKIRQRQKEGIAVAKANGVKFGKEPLDIKIDKPEDESVSAYCKRVGISRTTYYKYAS